MVADESPHHDLSDPIRESVKSATVGDQPSSVDRFGFDPYVIAISRFLSNKDTKPPLTVSIEGEWGSGKSSFMLQLQKRLDRELKDEPTRFVWFSPWRHDKQESMWAAFAMECSRQLLKPLSFMDRQKAMWRLKQLQFDWSTGLWDILRVLASVLLVLVALTVFVILVVQGIDAQGLEWIGRMLQGNFSDPPPGSSAEKLLLYLIPSAAGVSGIAALLTAARSIGSVLKDPFRYNLEKHLKQPNYAEQVSFLEQFNNDFKNIVKAYAPQAKVFVFVDDLDRCEVPKAAELMQAINLLIGSSPQLIFILAMDREKVAAGLAVAHKDLLEFLPTESQQPESSTEMSRQWRGLDYGYAFIEKFVQVAFRLPVPTDRDIERFLELLNEGASDDSGEEDEEPVEATVPDHDWQRFIFETGKDSDNVREVTKMVAPALDNNPRRLIQFINTFRLKAYVAHSTGLFNQVRKDGLHVSPLTFWQLAKFVAIGLKWPTFLIDLDAHRNLFEELERGAADTTPFPLFSRWNSIQPLKALISYGLEGEQEQPADDYQLSNIDLDTLLAISSEIERPHGKTEPIEDREPPPGESPPSPGGPSDEPPDSQPPGKSAEARRPEKPVHETPEQTKTTTTKKAAKKKAAKKTSAPKKKTSTKKRRKKRK